VGEQEREEALQLRMRDPFISVTPFTCRVLSTTVEVYVPPWQ
jgi:hypothetical protein